MRSVAAAGTGQTRVIRRSGSGHSCSTRRTRPRRRPSERRAGVPACTACRTRGSRLVSARRGARRRRRSEEHTSELQSRLHLVCRLLLEKKKKTRVQRTEIVEKTDAYKVGGRPSRHGRWSPLRSGRGTRHSCSIMVHILVSSAAGGYVCG